VSYFEIGIFNGKSKQNLGTLWRSAYQLGAHGIFTIGQRYEKQSSDTLKTWRHLPLRCFESFDEFYASIPFDCQLVGVEMGGRSLEESHHPKQAIYLLGAEDNGLPPKVAERCHRLISLSAVRTPSFNVAVAGSLVMYHRMTQLAAAKELAA
jgi:tRNA G18 (ribose-2'-O)-methylase SpoU